MNKRDTKRLASLVAKSSNQKDAILSYLSEGNQITADGAHEAGIADPRRVVNHLRKSGHGIARSVVSDRKGTSIVYALAPVTKSKKKATK